MARALLEYEPEVDSELVFDLFERLVEPLQREGRLSDLESLIRLVQTRWPEVYREDLGWYCLWRVENALLTPGGDVLHPLLEWAEHMPDNVEMFRDVVDRLRYHGRLKELKVALTVAWPKLRDNKKVLLQHIEEIRRVAMLSVIQQHLEDDATLDAGDRLLRADLEPYEPLPWEWIERYIESDTGRRVGAWRPEDVTGEDRFAAHRALDGLCMDFARALRARGPWPRSRADMAREEMLDYLLRRRESVTESEGTTRAGRSVAGEWIEAVLLPTRQVLEAELSRYFGPQRARVFPAAAFAGAIPAWMAFVERRNLVSSEAARRQWEQVRTLGGWLADSIDAAEYDPELRADLVREWETV